MERKASRIVASIALNTAFGYEPKVSREIINGIGGAERLLELSEAELSELCPPFGQFAGRLSRASLEQAEQEYERLSLKGCSFLCIEDEAYPSLLRECNDAPILLYCSCSSDASELFRKRPAIAVVGTRDISTYGSEWCTRVIQALAQAPAKPLIVSGLAYGVDVCAHNAALGMGLPTIGVLPVGIDSVYPLRHTAVAHRIAAAQGSALVTDYPPGMGAMTYNFLRRNRIIAGLCGATLLIESKVKGGGMMTARLAFGYGRAVYALPGRIDDLRSGGCNQLLWEKVAEPIYSLETLVESLGLGRPAMRKRLDIMSEVRKKYAADGNIVKVFSLIKGHRGVNVEELCDMSGLGFVELSRAVGKLERDGYICTDLLQRCTVVY